MRTTFLDLLKSSVIVQATMALSCLGAIIYLAVTDRPIPEVLVGGFMGILGYYFGSKRTMEG